jgi:DNA invertase Pin-like site-specific DNA recombinase
LARIGYARVSTTDQDLDIQIGRLKNAGCEIIRSETGSGASRSGRTELETIMQFMHTGDELVVLRLDRLGRSTRDVLNLVHELDEKGASLRILEPEVTTAGDMGRMVITILGMVADMELKFIKDRQRAGIEAARAEGVYKGRKKNVDDDEIRRRLAAGASKARVARDLKVSRMTVYRALDIIPSQTKLPEKPPTASIALHLIIENFNKRGRGRKPARERIEAMLERDYAMVKNGNCDYKLTVAYDPDPDVSTRSVVSNGPGRINQAFSVRSSTWPKSQLRADWAMLAPFDGFHETAHAVTGTCLISFDRNRYSVMAKAARRAVQVRAYADRIVVRLGDEVIAEHARHFGRDRTIYDPWHYLPVLANKPGALRNGAPFQGWDLPPALTRLRRKLGGGDEADRRFVRVLAAVMTDGLEAVEAAIREALDNGAVSDEVILNILARYRDPPSERTLDVVVDLKLSHPPIADCARYDTVRGFNAAA